MKLVLTMLNENRESLKTCINKLVLRKKEWLLEKLQKNPPIIVILKK